MSTRVERRAAIVAWMVVFAMTALPLMTAFEPDANAAVLCQRKKKKVKLRPTACKKKETLLQDLGQVGTDLQQLGTDVGAQESQLGTERDRVDELFDQFRLECLDASLTKVETEDSFYFDNIECEGGCRTHDGNQAACEAAWAVSEDGATSCFFFKNFCLPCADCGEEHGVCTNTCRMQVTVACPNDPTRTIFAGGPGTNACRRFRDQGECELAFHAGRGLRPATCYWNGSECEGCGPRNENQQDCTNTCRTVECSDPTRTVLRRCEDVGNDPVACAQTWHLSGQSGEPASCFFDADDNRCRGCGFPNEIRELCDNVCR